MEVELASCNDGTFIELKSVGFQCENMVAVMLFELETMCNRKHTCQLTSEPNDVLNIYKNCAQADSLLVSYICTPGKCGNLRYFFKLQNIFNMQK